MLSYGLYLDQLVGRKEVQYDVRKLSWIGSPEKSEVLDVHAQRRAVQNHRGYPQGEHAAQVRVHGNGGHRLHFSPPDWRKLWSEDRYRLGLSGGSEIDLAVEKGEVQCRGLTAAPYFGREPFISWRKRNFVNVLIYGGVKREREFPIRRRL